MEVRDLFLEIVGKEEMEKMVREALITQIEKTTKEVASEILGGWKFKGELEKIMSDKIAIQLKDVNVPRIQDELLEIMNEKMIEAMNMKDSAENFKKSLDSILKGEVETYELQELLDKIKEEYKEDEKIFLKIEKIGNSSFIYFDEEENIERYYMATHKLILDEHGHVKSYSCNEKDRYVVGDTYGLKGIIKEIYYTNSIIRVHSDDNDDYKLYHNPENEDYDY